MLQCIWFEFVHSCARLQAELINNNCLSWTHIFKSVFYYRLILTLQYIFSAHKYTVEKSAREKWVYVEGVVVSICLASIFLVALIVFVCYYRAQKNNGPSRYEITKSSSKGIFLTDFLKSNLQSPQDEEISSSKFRLEIYHQFLQLKLVLKSVLIVSSRNEYQISSKFYMTE